MKKLILLIPVMIILSCRNENAKKAEFMPEAIEMNNRGGQLLQEFKNDSALILFDKAIELNDSFYLPHLNKLGIYLKMKQYGNALSESEQVVKKNPDSAQGWFIAGLLNEHLGQTEKAMDYYEKSIQIYTERINNPDEEKNLNANRLNRALAKKFAGDESHIEDFIEANRTEELRFIVDQFRDRSKQEIMDKFLNNAGNSENSKLFDLNLVK